MYLVALHMMYALRHVNRLSEECRQTVQLGSWPSGKCWQATQSGQVATRLGWECRETTAAEPDTRLDRIENATEPPQRSHPGQPPASRTQENRPTVRQPTWRIMWRNNKLGQVPNRLSGECRATTALVMRFSICPHVNRYIIIMFERVSYILWV